MKPWNSYISMDDINLVADLHLAIARKDLMSRIELLMHMSYTLVGITS